MYYAYSVV